MWCFVTDARVQIGAFVGHYARFIGHHLEYNGSTGKLDTDPGDRHLHFRCYRDAAVGRWVHTDQMGRTVSFQKF